MARIILIVGEPASRSEFFSSLLDSIKNVSVGKLAYPASNQSLISFEIFPKNNSFEIKAFNHATNEFFTISELTAVSPERRAHATGVVQMVPSNSGSKQHARQVYEQAVSTNAHVEFYDKSEKLSPLEVIGEFISKFPAMPAMEVAPRTYQSKPPAMRNLFGFLPATDAASPATAETTNTTNPTAKRSLFGR